MRKVLFCIALFFFALAAKAQTNSFTAEVDTNRILIGEQFILTLSGEVEVGTGFIWPAFPDTVKGIELVEAGKLDTVSANGRWKLEQQLRLTSFDSGYTAIPPLTLQSDGQTYQSPPIGIGVEMPEVSEQQQFYDIKKPLDPPVDWLFWILAGSGVLLLAVIVAVIIYFLSERKKRKSLTPEQLLTPYEYAQKQLWDIEKEKLWQKGKVKEYYSRITDVMRLYMHRQLGMNAMESTADEVIELTESLGMRDEMNRKIAGLMRLSVMVKYAKETPEAGAHDRSLATVKEFIEENKPMEVNKESGPGSLKP